MKTLILNQTYEPLMTLPWQRAMVMVMVGKAQIIEAYDATINTVREAFEVPAVVRLVKRVRVWRRHARFSRKAVYQRDAYRCQYCNVKLPGNKLTLDHVLPRSRGGKKNWTNIVASCLRCNLDKGDRTPQEAGMSLLSKPGKPTWSKNVDSPAEWRDYLWS